MDKLSNIENEIIPAVALRGITVFPNSVMHFDVGRKRSINALEHALTNSTPVFLVTQRSVMDDNPGQSGLYKTGTVAYVKQLLKMPGDNIRAMVQGAARADISEVISFDPFISVKVTLVPDINSPKMIEHIEASARVLRSLFARYAELSPKLNSDVTFFVENDENTDKLAEYIAQNIPISFQYRQRILKERRIYGRLELMCSFLSHEIEILSLESKIQEKTQDTMTKNQKDYYIREQIKVMQNELGETEDPLAEADEYRKKLSQIKMPDEGREKLLKEIDRLSKLSYMSPESGVIRTYIDTCLELPWNVTTEDRTSLDTAKEILDSKFYGMNKVKERIIEYLAVRTLNKDLKGQVICLIGPPGTGKTSIGMAIAETMNRKLARISLGGMRDEADIRGHRKTYIGSMPGRIMNAMKLAGSKNPVMLLDEIDKMGNDFRGDPASAMLEVLDSEQNHAFRDHYIEIPFDLSDVLFILTANNMETIPRPLLDRMEIIEIDSYTDEEKFEIAKRHLLPRQLKKHGLRKTNLRIGDEVIRDIISSYTRESGVRSLERELGKVCRKTAKKIASGEVKTFKLTLSNLEDLIGPRRYKEQKLSASSEIGLVNGLAWTSVGGEILPVEVNTVEGTGKIELTGNLGEVMKESAHAAISCIRSRCDSLGIDRDFYKNRDIHIHFPEGAIPKDGPSAGITIACALVSALADRPVRAGIAMTGEITIRGRILPIGGLKEKTMAAYRNGIKTVIIPTENKSDLAEIDPVVREALEFITADKIDVVLANALLSVPVLASEIAETAVPVIAPINPDPSLQQITCVTSL